MQAVSQSAQTYNDQVLKGPADVLIGSMRRIAEMSSDPNFAAQAEALDLEMRGMPAMVAMNATGLHDAAHKEDEDEQKSADVETIVPRTSRDAVQASWKMLGNLGNRGDAVGQAARNGARAAQQLDQALRPDNYEMAVLDQVAQQFLPPPPSRPGSS